MKTPTMSLETEKKIEELRQKATDLSDAALPFVMASQPKYYASECLIKFDVILMSQIITSLQINVITVRNWCSYSEGVLDTRPSKPRH